MPLIKRITNLTAIGDVATPIGGSQYEYLPFPARIEVAVLADTGDVVTATFFSGTDVLLENAQLDEKAVAEPIQYPWDYDLEDVAAAGERLGLTLTAQSALSVVRTRVRITPL